MEGNYTSGRPSKLIRSFAQLLLHLLTILRSNLAPTTRLPTGGGLAMPARIQMAGPTLEDGLQTKRTPPRTTHGGSTTKYHWRITLGPTKTVTQPVGFPVWKCSALPPAHGKQSSAPYPAELDFRQPGQHLRTPQPEDQANAHFCLFDAAHRHAPYKAGVQRAPSHMKRDFNQWADELIHPHFTWFRPDRQLPESEVFSHFKFLWSLLDSQPLRPNCKRRKTDQRAT